MIIVIKVDAHNTWSNNLHPENDDEVLAEEVFVYTMIKIHDLDFDDEGDNNVSGDQRCKKRFE